MTDTIFALSSGQPPAAIALIRVSGPDAGSALDALAGHRPAPRRAVLAALQHPTTQVILDHALLLWFPGPNSATGEDLAEIHCHGGRAVVRAVEDALLQVGGLRAALPGEFTRRAFENGRIDLNEAEGLADMLFAETEAQRRAALAMNDGHFSRRIEGWRSDLLALSAIVEACLDFSDEDDVPSDSAEQQLRDRIDALIASVALEARRPSAERLRDGIRVVIAGPPNAGKSTLLNALAGRDAAIVSDIAGTTRDRIDVAVAIGGIAYLLTDTAGLRAEAGTDAIEWQGIGRARAAMDTADIILWLGVAEDAPGGDVIRVGAQCDRRVPAACDVAVSAHTGDGMAALIVLMEHRARSLLPAEGEYALHQRQRDAVCDLGNVLTSARDQSDLLIVAEHLRAARGAIDRLTGRAGTEDMLDTLFSGFCIGK